MKRLLILLLTGLFAQLVVSCYPEGADNIEDYDVAITNYDKGADFSAFTTFSIPVEPIKAIMIALVTNFFIAFYFIKNHARGTPHPSLFK